MDFQPLPYWLLQIHHSDAAAKQPSVIQELVAPPSEWIVQLPIIRGRRRWWRRELERIAVERLAHQTIRHSQNRRVTSARRIAEQPARGIEAQIAARPGELAPGGRRQVLPVSRVIGASPRRANGLGAQDIQWSSLILRIGSSFCRPAG